jgi:hypothetical protein
MMEWQTTNTIMGVTCSSDHLDKSLVKALLRGDLKDAETAIKNGANPNFIHKSSSKPIKFKLATSSPKNQLITRSDAERLIEFATKYGKDAHYLRDLDSAPIIFVLNSTINYSSPLHLCVSLAIYNEIYSQCFPNNYLFERKSIENIASLLIEKGGNVNATDQHLDTPLHYVSRTSHVDLGQLLVHHGASNDKVNKKGMTPLTTAFTMKQLNTYIGLRNKGDDPGTKCLICTIEPRNTILIPCGHYNYCSKCVVGLQLCPVCRVEIGEAKRVYEN